MNNYKIPVFSLLIIVIGCVFSCKKKNNPVPFSNQKIATVDYTHSGEMEHYRVVYDQYSNVDSIIRVGDGTASGNNGSKSFVYLGSSFSITDETGNSFTVYANTSGVILEVLVTDTLIMHYNNNQLSELDTKTPTGTPPYYTLTSVYYNWTNGDVASFGPMGTTTSAKAYYYDLSKDGQPGDVTRIDDFLTYGRSYIRNTHLAKGLIIAADTVENYSYRFDNLGRISKFVKMTNSGGVYDSMVYNYRYY
ncbi:MAG: hypothetical protein ACHQD8_04575 [Chitinophagales bacterium]